MNKTLMALLSTATMLCASGTVNAEGSVQGSMGVSLTIGAGCVVEGENVNNGDINYFGALNFGSYSSLAQVIDGSTTSAAGTEALSLICTDGTEYTVELDNGRYVTGGTQRRMASVEGDYISYNLYRDAARTTPWGTGANALTGTGTAPLTVYGRVPTAATTPAAGVYNDIVTMTVSW